MWLASVFVTSTRALYLRARLEDNLYSGAPIRAQLCNKLPCLQIFNVGEKHASL